MVVQTLCLAKVESQLSGLFCILFDHIDRKTLLVGPLVNSIQKYNHVSQASIYHHLTYVYKQSNSIKKLLTTPEKN